MKLTLVLCLLTLAGCAANGPAFSDGGAGTSPIPDGRARIIFFRTRDSALYVARRASITVDGKKVGATAYGGYHFHDLPAGEHTIRADMWDSPGHCELTLNAEPAQTYYFQVDPRTESFGAFAAAGFAASLLSNGVLADVAGGLAGNAAESYGQACGGAFRLYPVDAGTASARLANLRLSD